MEQLKYARTWDELSPREQIEFTEAIATHRACDADLGFPFALWDEYSEMGKCLCVEYYDPEKNQTYCYHYKYRENAKGWSDNWPKADGWHDWHWWQQDEDIIRQSVCKKQETSSRFFCVRL